MTGLADDEWVCTPTRDVQFLLQRKDNEEVRSWQRQWDLAARTAVLTAQTGRKYERGTTTEVWAFDGAPAIGPTIKAGMATAKAAGSPEATWVNHVDPPVRSAELAFKEALRNAQPSEKWLRDNPKPTFETRGGVLGDTPQVAVTYLKGKSMAAAKDAVLKQLLGISPVKPEKKTHGDPGSSSGTTSDRSRKGKENAPAAGTQPDSQRSSSKTRK
jgi:hypothetical protein